MDVARDASSHSEPCIRVAKTASSTFVGGEPDCTVGRGPGGKEPSVEVRGF